MSGLQVIEGITNRLGSAIWSNTFIGFTHGKLRSLPDGLSYGESRPLMLLDPKKLVVLVEGCSLAPLQAIWLQMSMQTFMWEVSTFPKKHC